MKILIRLGAVGFAVLIVALVAFYVYIDAIAGAAIEKGSTYALGVDTKVGFVRIGLLTGSFRIGSLKIEKQRGKIAKGMAADIIATPDSPLENVQALRKVMFVMKNGKVVKDTR